MEKLLFTPSEAAEALAISRSKLYELLSAGALPSVRIGTCRRISADALKAFLELMHEGVDEPEPVDRGWPNA